MRILTDADKQAAIDRTHAPRPAPAPAPVRRLHRAGPPSDAEQAAALAQAAAEREQRYVQPRLEASVLKPPPPPTLADLRSKLISLDREITTLQRGRQAIYEQMADLSRAKKPTK